VFSSMISETTDRSGRGVGAAISIVSRGTVNTFANALFGVQTATLSEPEWM